MTTNQRTRRESSISIDGGRPLTDYVGRPYCFVTYDGDTIEGTTELVNERLPHVPVPVERLIVRFADGSWAYALVNFDA